MQACCIAADAALHNVKARIVYPAKESPLCFKHLGESGHVKVNKDLGICKHVGPNVKHHTRKKTFCYTNKIVKVGMAKIFCYNNKMFGFINKTFGCCGKIFGCSNKKSICCPQFCCRNKTIFFSV